MKLTGTEGALNGLRKGDTGCRGRPERTTFAPMPLSHAAVSMLERAIFGLVAAGAISFVAHRAGSLSRSGVVAATLLGTAAVATDWRWGALLIVYFVTSSLLSRLGRARKEQLTAGVVAKSGARDATQVIANGGIFAVSALLASFGTPRFALLIAAAAVGALATAAADTWATEIGTLVGGTPRSVLHLRLVPPGTSGGVSAAGSIAMVAGAAFIAVVAASMSLAPDIGRMTAAGGIGAAADSLLGATLQERRWCDACDRSSERAVHDCGTTTKLVGGREWMDNDAVNLLATVVGATVAAMLAYIN